MRRQHYRIFWIKEFDRLLQNLEEKDDSERFKDAVRAYLKWELALHFLPQLASRLGNDAYVAILTYYSTFFADPRGENPSDFIRVPVTSLSLTFPSDYLHITPEHHDFIKRADAAARRCLMGHPLLEGIQATLDGDASKPEEPTAFLGLIQKDVLAPVNLAEALNVDFHLPPAYYKGVVDKLLFSSLSGLDGRSAVRAKAEAMIRWAGLAETPTAGQVPDAVHKYEDALLDQPLFTRESVTKAKELVRDACERLRECRKREQISSGVLSSSTRIMKQLVSELTFDIAPPTGARANPPGNEALPDGECPTPRLDEQTLYRLPLRLLGFEDDAHIGAVSLQDLWDTRVDAKYGELPDDYRLMLLPTLPFFLLALYWDGTYRHLIQFALPPFVLDFDELHVETIDLCGEPPDLLYQLCCYLIALEDENKAQRETLPDNVSRMIRKNAIGNLVILRKLSGEGRTAEPDTGFEWIEQLDTTVRGALNPIRRRERYAELQREIVSTKRNETALAERLHNAYSRLSQDFSTIDDSMHKFNRRLESLAPPSMGDDQQALSMRKSLREVIRSHKSNILEAAIALEEKQLCRYLHPASLPEALFKDGSRFSAFIDEVKKEFEEGLWDYLSPDERAEFTTNPQWSFNAIKTLISNAEGTDLSDLKSTLGKLLDITGLKGKFRPATGQVLLDWLLKSNRSLAEQVRVKLQMLPERHVTFFYKDGLTKLQELIKTPSHLEVVQYVEGGLKSNIISITQRHQEGDGEKVDKGLLYCDEKDALDWFRGRPRQSHLYKIFLLLSSYGPLLFERYNETDLKPSAEPYMAVRMQHPYIEALSGSKLTDIQKEFRVEPLDRRAEELGQAIRFSFLFWTKTQ